MIQSMTGFGQGVSDSPMGQITLEVKTVNNRYLEVQVRSPRSLSSIEDRVREFISARLSRGSIFVNVYAGGSSELSGATVLNPQSAKSHLKELVAIQKSLKLKGDISIGTLLDFIPFCSKGPIILSEKAAWKHTRPALQLALSAVKRMRAAEGRNLEKQIRRIIRECSKAAQKIRKRLPARKGNYSRRLKNNIQELMGTGKALDPTRLATEIAYMAERLDITEECDRLQSHFNQFEEALDAKGPIGKRLGFLLQEMNREANTIGAKANDGGIAAESVSIKERIEMLREQIQNIE